jgi:hypothetical protein
LASLLWQKNALAKGENASEIHASVSAKHEECFDLPSWQTANQYLYVHLNNL